MSLARTRNPEVAAAAARVGEARGRMVQAGLYPNPTVGYQGNQINDGPGTAGLQGGFVAQEFVTGGKLRIAREAARFGVTAADWQAASTWFDTTAKVKRAYYEYTAAIAVLRETKRLEEQFIEALSRSEKLAAGGKAAAYDVTRLKVAVVETTNRVGNARERVVNAERRLAIAVGVEQLPGVAAAALSSDTELPAYDEAVELSTRSSFVMEAAAVYEQSRVEVQSAEVQPIPNVTVSTFVGHSNVLNVPMLTVQAGLPVPLWDRNQGNITAAKYRLQAAEAAIEKARLSVTGRLADAYRRYENARRLLELYRTKVLPDAAAALEQIDKIYEVRGERFFDTLDARRVLAQARIDYAEALRELWTAVADIEAVVQFARE